MALVVEEDGFRIMVLTRNEHNPPHVHVYRAGGECRVKIGESPAMLWDVKGGLTLKEASKAEALVRKHQAACLRKWEEKNGHLGGK